MTLPDGGMGGINKALLRSGSGQVRDDTCYWVNIHGVKLPMEAEDSPSLI